MRLAISSIAWDVAEDAEIADLLQCLGVDAIDVVPGKYFSDLINLNDEDLYRVRRWWSERGIEITGMQSLLFGTTGLNVFGNPTARGAMLEHLRIMCKIGAGLGATRLVFGSPRNRDRSGLADSDVMDIAVPFFKQLGDIAQACGVVVCLEPNPTCYGANFMNTANETAMVVEQVSHQAIMMQLDTGALTINGEDISVILKQHAHLIGHIHASEPDLLPFGEGGTNHEKSRDAVVEYLPNHVVSIEMLATKSEPHIVSVKRALNLAIQSYR